MIFITCAFAICNLSKKIWFLKWSKSQLATLMCIRACFLGSQKLLLTGAQSIPAKLLCTFDMSPLGKILECGVLKSALNLANVKTVKKAPDYCQKICTL